MFLTNLRMGRKRLAVLGFVGAALLVAPALATLPSGAAGVIHARGTVSEKVKVREPKNTDFVTHQITIQPGGHTGWHTHPGATLVTVKSGTLTLTDLRQRDDDDDDDRGHRRGRCETRSFSARVRRGHRLPRPSPLTARFRGDQVGVVRNTGVYAVLVA